MKDDEAQECQFTDGLYQRGHPECESCYFKIRSACRAFSIYNGLREAEYYLHEEKEEPVAKETTQSMSLAEKIKRIRKQW
jgi:hypothetical protein